MLQTGRQNTKRVERRHHLVGQRVGTDIPCLLYTSFHQVVEADLHRVKGIAQVGIILLDDEDVDALGLAGLDNLRPRDVYKRQT